MDEIQSLIDESVRMSRAAVLGAECAEEFLRAVPPTTDSEGRPLWPSEPLDGDWDALRDVLGETTLDDEAAFRDAYCAALDAAARKAVYRSDASCS